MTPRKLNLFIGLPSYGGNGGIQSEVPDIREWFTETILWAKADPRIGEIHSKTIGDTPVTMVRNRFVQMARANNCDVLVMCDSDQHPNKHRDDPGFKPFVQSSFDFLYQHYDRGPVVIGAPYCGPPPVENVYVFRWDSQGIYGDETGFSLEPYSRHEAAQMRGIQECAALPTGLIMYDMRAFELTEPSHLSKRTVLQKLLASEIDIRQAERMLSEGWFYYEWKNGYASEKASTEDVTNTRDISLAGAARLGYNPVYCNWDSPIGHWKPWCVPGRPARYGAEQISSTFHRAVLSDAPLNQRIIHADLTKELGITESHYGNGKPPKHKTPSDHLQALKDLVEIEFESEEGHHDGGWMLEVCEVGSWHGDSARAMASTGLCKVMCVDHWQGSDGLELLVQDEPPLRKFLANCKEEIDAGIINYRTGKSVEIAKDFEDSGRQFDIIFIDADHSYEATKADIEAWMPCLREGGVMVGHDYRVHQFPGVTKAVHETLGDHAKPYAWCQDYGGFWIYRKEPSDVLVR